MPRTNPEIACINNPDITCPTRQSFYEHYAVRDIDEQEEDFVRHSLDGYAPEEDDLTPEEVLAMLLSNHEGEAIEIGCRGPVGDKCPAVESSTTTHKLGMTAFSRVLALFKK